MHKCLKMERGCFPIKIVHSDIMKRNMEGGRVFHM